MPSGLGYEKIIEKKKESYSGNSSRGLAHLLEPRANDRNVAEEKMGGSRELDLNQYISSGVTFLLVESRLFFIRFVFHT